jgi:hypothetical protein
MRVTLVKCSSRLLGGEAVKDSRAFEGHDFSRRSSGRGK